MPSPAVADQGFEPRPSSSRIHANRRAFLLFHLAGSTFLSPSLGPPLGFQWDGKMPVPVPSPSVPASSKPLRKGKVATCQRTFWNVLQCAPLALRHLCKSLALFPGEEVGAGHLMDLGLSGWEHPVCALYVQFPTAVQQVSRGGGV